MRTSLLLLLTLASLGLSPVAHGEILYSEDFETGLEGESWNGFQGWTGSSIPIIARATTGALTMTGRFPSGVTDPAAIPPAAMSLAFTNPFSTAEAGYRFAFDLRGSIDRTFQVILESSSGNRIGLQVGDAAERHRISGVVVENGVSQLFSAYNETSSPAGFNSGLYYHVTLDLNHTTHAIEIGGDLLASGKGRLVFNSTDVGALNRYSVVFDLPENLGNLSGIQVAKVASTAAHWNIDNLQLESYPVTIPEPGTTALLIGGGGLLLGWSRRRRSSR